MFINEKTTIFARQKARMRAEAYINEYSNQASLKNTPATDDYRRYMTKSLINRGFLFKNYDNVERMYKATLQELFSTQFKNIFLYALDRDISGIYNDITNVKNMGPIGIYDFFSSITTCIYAKYLPTFEPFKLQLSEVNITISDEKKKELIDLREDKSELPVIYTELTEEEITTGPIENIEYYTLNINNDGEEPIEEYILCENLTEFEENTTYYTKTLDYDNIELTTDEIADEKMKLITEKVDNDFEYYLKDLCVSIKELFSKYDLYTLSSAVNYEADKFEKATVQIIYAKFIHIFATLAYAISVSRYLTENSKIMSIINKFISIGLSKCTILGETISTKAYFSDKIVNNTLNSELKEGLFGRFSFSSPVSDAVDASTVYVSVNEESMVFTENLMKLRHILDLTNIENEIDLEKLLIISLISFTLFIQMFYNSAYISKHKVPITKSVQELLRCFEPSYDKIISSESLKKFIKLGE
jgi:hypothetical protein